MARPRSCQPKVKHKKFSGKALRRERKRAGLAAVELAYLVGRTVDTIYQWESGRAGEPRASDLAAFASALDCSIEDLFEEES